MQFRLLTGIVLCCLAGLPSFARASDGSDYVVFILDCSQSMSDELPEMGSGDAVAASDQGNPTRLDAARDELLDTLQVLSEEGDHQVAVWLYGHRLAWSEGEEPELLEQNNYLEASLGFNALKELLPGDDVELTLPLQQLYPQTLAKSLMRFDAVQPWGENPLYLALVRALENLPSKATAMNTKIVVITDRANHQYLTRFKTTHEDVARMLDQVSVPIHFISIVGSEEDPLEEMGELEKIAQSSGGHFLPAHSQEELRQRMEAVLTQDDAELEEDPIAEALATVATPVDSDAPVTLSGVVIFNDKPVKKTKISLEGGQVVSVKTDASGRFTLTDVPPGSYTIKAEGIVKNLYRRQVQQVAVRPGKKQPRLLIVLE